jgi:pimeloyl-ACP methyl ester carboxylesterase
MAEQFAQLGDVRLCYETFGEPGDPCIVLIMGLGMQLVGWPDPFCQSLADQGRYVVRFDNRDSGRSTAMRDLPAASPLRLATRLLPRRGYRLDDLAADVVGLLDHLAVSSAHVVGASMGAMIGQTVAARWPHRVCSLVSIMGSTGSRLDGQPSPRAWPYLLRRVPQTKATFVRRLERLFRLVGSPGFPRDEAWLRQMLETSFDRGFSSEGMARQLAAVFASGNRRAELRTISAPTLVIHGTADRLIRLSGGRATARAIPGARLFTVHGLGHDLPSALHPTLVTTITNHTERQGNSCLV